MKHQNENTQNLGVLVFLVKFLLWVSGVTIKRSTSTTKSRLTPPTSHTLLCVGQDLSGNTCRAYSLWRQQPVPLLKPTTCLMMTAAHSPVYNRVTLPVPVLLSSTFRSTNIRVCILLINNLGLRNIRFNHDMSACFGYVYVRLDSCIFR